MSLSHAANPGRHALSERGNDLYETPAEATRALLKIEQFPKLIWEPACGPGSIVSTLRDAGHIVFASDLVDYDCPESQGGLDFLLTQKAPFDADCIITNPPYKLAGEFITHALYDLGIPKVAMLLRLAFLESERRRPILDNGHLSKVHVFRNRLPMMHRDGWAGPKASSSIAFAWFIWELSHSGPTTLNRISWERA